MTEFDDATRRRFAAARAKIAEEIIQMVNDADHWNRTHPNEEPIVIDTNLAPDVARLMAAEAFPPSAFILDEMTSREWTLGDLSENSGISIERLSKLLDHNERLEQEDTECLGMAFDVDPALFANLQRSYDAKTGRSP